MNQSLRNFRDRRVVAFLAAESFSAIGNWATLVAIWGYAAYEFDATAADIARFGIASAAAGIVVTPVSGILIDRYGSRSILALSKVIGIVASLAMLGADDFGTLALLSAAHGASAAFGIPALQSMPPRLVDDEHLASTNALVALTDEFAIVLGPVAAGVSIAVVGFRGAFIFDALTFALGLVVLPLVRLRPVGEADESPATIRDALEGLTTVLRRGMLRRTVGLVAVVHLLYGAAVVTEPLYVRDVLGKGPTVFAALQTVFGGALVLAGLGVARAGERLADFRWLVAGGVGSGVFAVAYLATPWIVVSVLGVAAWGVVTAGLSGPSRTLLQRATPTSRHGRILATDYLASSVFELLGVASAGFVIGAVGVPTGIAIYASLVVAASFVAYIGDRRDPETEGGNRNRRAGPALSEAM